MVTFVREELKDFHTIKTKPISRQRTTAQDHEVVTKWFQEYSKFLHEKSIQQEDLWNMDETGFRIGIPGGEQVIVPTTVHELYTPSPENRTSITVVEAVSASGKVIPPVLIIQGKRHMESWYTAKTLSGDEKVLLSESGYTNDELAIQWLQHFIQHTSSSATTKSKVLLLDSHASHCTPEFTILAQENNIIPYTFPSHLTHILQPLDVGIFHPYKHWHKRAVQYATRNLDLDYNISSFFRDLASIRENTFKSTTIIHAFQKAGMWPPSCTIALEKIKIYSKPELEQGLHILAPQLPQIPSSFLESEHQLQQWKSKVLDLLSSPSRPHFENWIKGTEEVLIQGQIKDLEHSILEQQV
jgi:hypothetical protein